MHPGSRILPEKLAAHPRVILSNEDWADMRKRVVADGVSKRIFQSLKKKADEALMVPPVARVMQGRRLLGVSRIALERILALATVAIITEDDRYARRAAEEILAVSSFTDWNPTHFLDVAEMAFGVATGYDWLHDQLTEGEREVIEGALLNLAIKPSLEESPNNAWVSRENNWNQVCHGGLSVAAIAVADHEPAMAERILRRAIEKLPIAATGYAPDGAYPEGPMYWNYGTSYHVLLIAALRRAAGQAFGLEAFPGFLESANYMVQATTPTGDYYCYSDGRRGREFGSALFWFAKELKAPRVVAEDIARLEAYLEEYDTVSDDTNFRFLALALAWRDPMLDDVSQPAPPLHWAASGLTPVAMHRTAWDDRRALFVGLKGGSMNAGHAHMDQGSFLLESAGVRWALDLGLQEYESLESRGMKIFGRGQDSVRWSVFRLGPESHNIIRFNDRPQLADQRAEIVRFRGEGGYPFSVIDLSAVYGEVVNSAMRGVMMLGVGEVLIQDEWATGDEEVEVCWQMLTDAEVFLLGDGFRLSRGKEAMEFFVLDRTPVRIEVQDVAELLKPHDVAEPGVKRIRIFQISPPRTPGKFRVVASSQVASHPEFTPLAQW